MTVLQMNLVVVVATVIPMVDPAPEEEAHRVAEMETPLVDPPGGDSLPTEGGTPVAVVVAVENRMTVTTEIRKTIKGMGAAEVVVTPMVMIQTITMAAGTIHPHRHPHLVSSTKTNRARLEQRRFEM